MKKQIPIIIKNEKMLHEEFAKIKQTIENTTNDWSERLSALKNIQQILQSDAVNYDSFVAQFGQLIVNLNIQLNDLRSQISIEASQVIILACDILKERLEIIADKLLNKESLLKSIHSAQRVILENGHNCIMSLIENVKNQKFIPKIIEEYNDKNQNVRLKCSQYIESIVNRYDINIIEKYTSQIDNYIVQALNDAKMEVRQNTRRCYFKYKELFPLNADQVYRKCDTNTQKYLVDDSRGLTNSTFSMSENQDKQLIKSPMKSKPIADPEDNKNAIKQQKSKSQVEDVKQLKVNKKANEDIQQQKSPLKKTQKVSIEDVDKKNTEKPPSMAHKKQNSVIIPQKEEDVQKSPMKKIQKQRQNSMNINMQMEEEIVPQKTIVVSIPPFKKNNKQNSISKISDDEKKFEKFDVQPPSTSTITQKNSKAQIHDRITPLDSSIRTMDSSSSQLNQDQKINNLINLNNKFPKPKKPQNNDQQSDKQFYMKLKEEDLELLIENTNNQNWSTRVTSFQEIQEIVHEIDKEFEHKSRLSEDLMQKIMDSHLNHLNDSHIKVQMACQNSLQTIVQIHSIEIYLEQIINKMTLNLADSKLSQKADNILQLIQQQYKGDQLIMCLVNALENSTKIKLKIILLDYIQLNIKYCENFFLQNALLRTFISKLVSCLISYKSEKQVPEIIIKILLILLVKNPSSINIILQIPQEKLQTLRLTSLQVNPQLEEIIKDQMIGSKTKIQNLEELIDINYQNISIKNDQNDAPQNKFKQNFSEAPFIKPIDKFKNIEQQQIQKDQPIQKQLKKDQDQVLINNYAYDEKQKLQEVQKINAQQDINEFSKIESLIKILLTGKLHIPVQYFIFKQPAIIFQLTSQSYNNNHIIFKMVILKLSKYFWQYCFNPPIIIRSTIDIQFYIYRDLKNNLNIIMNNINPIIKNLTNQIALLEENGKMEKSFSLCAKILKNCKNKQLISSETITGLLDLYHLPLQNFYFLDELFELMIQAVDRKVLLNALLFKIDSEQSPYLQIMIKITSSVIRSSKKEEIIEILDPLVDYLKININDLSADVRKTVVFCMVDLYILFGDLLQPYLSTFHPNQQKLIQIYIQRKLAQQ